MIENKYTIKEFSELFRKDNKELKRLRIFLKGKYGDMINNLETDKQLLNWCFASYPTIYHTEVYVQCNKKLSEYLFKGVNFVKVQIYKDESNLEYYSLLIGKYRKHFWKLDEVIEELKNSSSKGNFILPKKVISQGKGKSEEAKFKTEDNFYGNYTKGKYQYCSGRFYRDSSNLDICSITLGGNDDYSISQDYETYEKALKVWNKLKSQKYVNKSDLPDNYFTN